MQFRDIIGNSKVKGHLQQMVEHNRLSHALLFLGKEGSGALGLATALAQYMVCEKAGGRQEAEGGLFGNELETLPYPADSCGNCPACQKAEKMIHPDIHFSFPVFPKKPGDKPVSADFITDFREFFLANHYGNNFDWLQFAGAENKQGNIPVRECEEIIRKLNLKSFEGGYKILIMWMPEFLGKEGNKLLKLIEEPPPNSLLIFVTENEEEILQTIRSRTQLVKVFRPGESEIATALRQHFDKPEEMIVQSAMLSEGNVREAIMHLNNAEEDWQALLRDWLNAILSKGPDGQVKFVESVAKLGREKQKQFFRYFIQILEASVRLQALGAHNASLATSDQSILDLAGRINKICDIGQLEAIITELDKAIYYIERNANGKLLFHALTIRFYHIISNKSVILIN